MVLKSKFGGFGFWFSLTMFSGGLGILIYLLTCGLRNTPLAGQVFLFTALIGLIVVYGKLLFDANLIAIDTTKKVITFINIFTRRRTLYTFSDFDGKVNWNEPIKGGYVRRYYLIQNRKAVKKITSFIYSNQKELEEALIEIKDLGTAKYSYLKSWKVFLGYPIID